MLRFVVAVTCPPPPRRLAPRSGVLSGVAAVLNLALAAGLAGCASPGIPRPPSLHLPATVTDFTASRIGNRVELRWTAPNRTTDGLDLVDPRPVPTVVEICRDLPAPRPAQAPPCTPVLHFAGHPGPSTAVDTLPPTLTAPAARGLAVAYRLRVLNSSGRSAAPSARALIPAGPAVEDVTGFRATQTREGVVLEWNPAPGGLVEVLRTPVSPPPKAPPHATSRPSRADAPVSLRADPAAASLSGMIDPGAPSGATFVYRAQRVQPVSFEGATAIARSEPTAPITVALRDTFPPRPPSGLAAIPGTAHAPGGGPPTPTIDLSWQPNLEPDLAGYFVYRTDLDAQPVPRRLNPAPLPGPAFRDPDVLPGRRYGYRVTAIDLRGNESPPGPAVTETAVKPFQAAP